MPYTPSSFSSLGTAAPGVNPFDPEGSLATAATSLTDVCDILRLVEQDASDGGGGIEQILTVAYAAVPCQVVAATIGQMREAIVAESIEGQTFVPITVDYALDIRPATDTLRLTQNMGQSVSILYDILGTTKPHSYGGTQMLRCIKREASAAVGA
jgi:hypothetical protein